MPRDHSRRRFLRYTAAGAALIPLLSLQTRQAWAADKVAADDPMAVALKYVEDAAEAERPDKAGTPGEEQFCRNCGLYEGEDDWGACSIFQGRLVAAGGWCNVWVPAA